MKLEAEQCFSLKQFVLAYIQLDLRTCSTFYKIVDGSKLQMMKRSVRRNGGSTKRCGKPLPLMYFSLDGRSLWLVAFTIAMSSSCCPGEMVSQQ